jgi:beta-lactamase class A
MRLLPLCILSVTLLATACAASRPTPRVDTAATARVEAGRARAGSAAPGPLDGLLANLQPDPTADYGLLVEDLASGQRLTLNEQRLFPSASVYKLPLAWEVVRQADRGALSLDAPLDITDEDAHEVEPEGGLAPGETTTVGDALKRMVSVSSNASAHALLRTLGRAEFNQSMQQQGLTQTRVPEVLDVGDEAVTTVEDLGRLLRTIANGQGLSASAHSQLRDLLALSQFPDPLRETLPHQVEVLDKTGTLDDASNVGALLSTDRGTVIVVVLDQGVDPGDARGVIAQVGRAAYEAYLQ